ncbi:DUF4440 domain-containing protein [Candidatus Methylospira mobilis]|uniref:nuclear transport factor 2 family protein n=1 Tax=Candidatus Methylospira mobilis TaxID=1808979 RepID=UPI0028EA350E|nr:DUF4440 domain-containing protein [Candidatus Methylospira mobilis]WNV05025.1 DUF4440 domain-containing protein [Candidatus Methylospira mobilis]
MAATPSLAAQLETLERELHSASARQGSRAAELLADDFVEFGRSGRSYSKVQILEALGSEPADLITSSEYKLSLLSPTVALLTYKSQRNTDASTCTLRSSIWRQQGEAWQMVFHQGTPTKVRS